MIRRYVFKESRDQCAMAGPRSPSASTRDGELQARRLRYSKTEGHGRDARATSKVKRGYRKHAFCETNPNFLATRIDVTYCGTMRCVENVKDYKWVRFWRERHVRGRLYTGGVATVTSLPHSWPDGHDGAWPSETDGAIWIARGGDLGYKSFPARVPVVPRRIEISDE
jgi:hypothetical protein